MNTRQIPQFTRRIPEGDDRERRVCDHCGFVDYENPHVLAGSVVAHDGGILLCRRAITPRDGYWTLPAGYLELGESPEEGARREAREEACAEIEIDRLLAVYSVTRISQVQLIYRASLTSPSYTAGPESREVAVFGWEQIPWDELAFPSVHWALEDFDRTRRHDDFAPLSRIDVGEGGL